MKSNSKDQPEDCGSSTVQAPPFDDPLVLARTKTKDDSSSALEESVSEITDNELEKDEF